MNYLDLRFSYTRMHTHTRTLLTCPVTPAASGGGGSDRSAAGSDGPAEAPQKELPDVPLDQLLG